MSTSYYALKRPAVTLRPWPSGNGVWIRDRERRIIGSIRMGCLPWAADRDVKVAHRGNDGDIVVTHPGPDDMQAISEYGELVTLGQLRRGEAP